MNKWKILVIGTIKVIENGLDVDIELPGWEFDGGPAGKLITNGASKIQFKRDPYLGTTAQHLDHILIVGYSITELIKISQANASINASIQNAMNSVVFTGSNTPQQGAIAPDPEPVVPGKPRKPRPKFGYTG